MTGTLRILIVDDNEDLRELYSLWLEQLHTVETAHNGIEAIDNVSEQVDLVLLDRNMPGPDGLDAADKMRENGYSGAVVMVSSEPVDFDMPASAADDYIKKPADRDDFEHVVEQAVKRRLQSALDEYYALTETLASIEETPCESTIEADGEYADVEKRLNKKRQRLRELLEAGVLDWKTAFSALDDPNQPESTRAGKQDSIAVLKP